MHRFVGFTKLTILSLLIFANSIILRGQTDSIYRLPAGTRIRLKLDTELNSQFSSLNDTFLAVVSRPLKIHDSIVLPSGTIVEGRVSEAAKASAGGKEGKLNVVFETIRFPDTTRQIEGIMVHPVRAGSSRSFALISIIAGTAAGAIIGSVSESSSGTFVGAGIGAAAGTGVALARKGREARIRKAEEFEIELKKEVLLPVLDY